MSKVNKEVVNNVVVVGEVVDLLNMREGSCQNGNNEYFKYTLRLETNPETGETIDVEFFSMKYDFNNNIKKQYVCMDKIYNEVATKVQDGKGDVVRALAKLTSNSYVNKNGEIINNIVLQGSFMERDKDTKKDKNKFIPGCNIQCLGLIDKVEKIDDETVKFEVLINEYKSAKSIKGHMVELYAKGKGAVQGTSHLEKDMLVPFGAQIVNDVETIFLPEEDTELIDTEGAWGTELEKIEKENERRTKLREEGIKRYITKVVLTGARKPLTDEEIEEQGLPFDNDSINDMFEAIDDMRQDLENEAAMKKMGSEDEGVVPF